MNIKKIKDLEAFSGQEGTQIRQIFSPIDTNNAIRYSIAHCTISPGNSSKPHTMKTSEIYYFTRKRNNTYRRRVEGNFKK